MMNYRYVIFLKKETENKISLSMIHGSIQCYNTIFLILHMIRGFQEKEGKNLHVSNLNPFEFSAL